MTTAREDILASLRQTLGRGEDTTTTTSKVQQQLQQHVRGPQPGWSEDDVNRFLSKLESVAGTLSRVTGKTEVVTAIHAYLQQHALPLQLVSAKSAVLDELDWPAEFTVEQRRATGTDITVLTEAFAGVAETGSLVLLSGMDSPTSLNFLPDNYVCVLRRDHIVRHIEDVWDRIRQQTGRMPRAVNFITGPSRTADVEQTIQLGAHGPRRLHVILLE
jgi:L-lactate dehydrogenase complex protein LldG